MAPRDPRPPPVVVFESIASIGTRWRRELFVAEMAFTLLFTVEYILRLIAVRRPLTYARSFLGVVDLLAVAPTWLTLFVPGKDEGHDDDATHCKYCGTAL